MMPVIVKDPIIVQSGEDHFGDSLSAIRKYVVESCKEAGLPKEVVNRLRLAVDEIAANIMIHGYDEAGLQGEVKASAVIDDAILTITLEDSAPFYDPRSRPAPKNLNDPLDTRGIGGLGVYLALKNVDKFDYEYIDHKNINRFGINLNRDASQNAHVFKLLLRSRSEEIDRFLREALPVSEFNLVMVNNDDALLQTLQHENVDLILLDLGATTLPPLDLLTTLQGNTQIQSPVIIVTDNFDIEPILQCIDTGANDFILLPHKSELMQLRIRANIERAKLQQAKMKSLTQTEDRIKRIFTIDPAVDAHSPTLNIDAFLHHVLAEIKGMYNADAGTVYYREGNRLRFVVVQTDSIGVTLGGNTDKPITFAPLPLYLDDNVTPNTRNIAPYVALHGETINIPNIYTTTKFDFSATKVFDAENHYKSISCLAIPLKNHLNEVIGVVQLLNAQSPDGRIVTFDGSKQGITESLCAHVATILTNRLLIQQQMLMNKIEHDLEIGRQIQRTFLPTVFPNLDGWEVASYFQPAREVAGDFYDVFLMPSNCLGLVIADVCDKGVGAALFMSLMRSLIRAYAMQHYTADWSVMYETNGGDSLPNRPDISSSTASIALANAIQLTNQYVSTNHGDLNMFATTFFGVLDPITGTLQYINGGHCPPLILDKDGMVKARLEPTGPAVGMFSDSTFEMDEVILEPGDTLFAFTDGVADTRSPSGARFKDNGILELLQPATHSVQQLLHRVRDRLENFKGDAVQFDDITMLGLRREL
jgi:phosphoserine phosphatase RsbU/P